MVELCKRLVSWVTCTFKEWFWEDVTIQRPIENNQEDEEILGI